MPSAEEEAVVPGALSAPALPLALPARAPSAPRMRSKFNPLHQPEMAGSDSTATGLGGGGAGTAARSASKGCGLGRGATSRVVRRGKGTGRVFFTTAGFSTMYFGTGRAGTTTLGTGARAAGCAATSGCVWGHCGRLTGGRADKLCISTTGGRGGTAAMLGSTVLSTGVVTGEFEGNSDSACAAASVRDAAKIMLMIVSEAPAARAR